MKTGKKITNVWTVALVAMCVATFSASTVFADPVTVTNPSFEDDGSLPTGWTATGDTGIFTGRAS